MILSERKKRAAFIAKCLKQYPGHDEWDNESNVIDLIANALHYARLHDIAPSRVLRMALAHFETEVMP